MDAAELRTAAAASRVVSGALVHARPLLLGALALTSAAPLYIAVRSYRIERADFVGQRHVVSSDEARRLIAGLVDFGYPLPEGGTIRGWYAPSRNRAAVILTHGTSDDRTSVLAEATALAAAGFGVALFDWPGYGESDGPTSWGTEAVSALTRAVDWVSARPDVDRSRIGAFGFSMGGCMIARVAPHESRIRAAVLAGTPLDIREVTLREHRRWGPLSQWPALLAIRVSGMDLDALRPGDHIAEIAPRPLLLISGKEDPLVTPEMVRKLFARALEPKSLWFVPGAKHGGYASAAPVEYAKRLTEFFSKELL